MNLTPFLKHVNVRFGKNREYDGHINFDNYDKTFGQHYLTRKVRFFCRPALN